VLRTFFMPRIISFILFSCLVLVLKAQDRTLLQKIFSKPHYDSNYVVSYYKDYLHFTLVNLHPNQRVTIANIENNQRVSLKPNTKSNYGFGIDYRFVTIELSKAFDALNAPDPQKGKSENFSFRAGLTGRRILASALIQTNKGVYISNPQSVFPNWNVETNGYPQRGDIVSSILFGSLNYFFNHTKYSTMASLWQIDRQKRSAGSAVVGISASQSAISGDSALTPPFTPKDLEPSQRIEKASNYLVGLNFGYAYNLIFKKKIFFNAFLIPGLNLQYGNYETDKGSIQKYSSRVGMHGDIRLIGGYNGEHYYYGVHYSNYIFQNNLESNLDINSFNSYLRIFIGRRFDLTPKRK
jgi:hypothetical protein